MIDLGEVWCSRCERPAVAEVATGTQFREFACAEHAVRIAAERVAAFESGEDVYGYAWYEAIEELQRILKLTAPVPLATGVAEANVIEGSGAAFHDLDEREFFERIGTAVNPTPEVEAEMARAGKVAY